MMMMNAFYLFYLFIFFVDVVFSLVHTVYVPAYFFAPLVVAAGSWCWCFGSTQNTVLFGAQIRISLLD